MNAVNENSQLLESCGDPWCEHRNYLLDMLEQMSNLAAGIGEGEIAATLRGLVRTHGPSEQTSGPDAFIS